MLNNALPVEASILINRSLLDWEYQQFYRHKSRYGLNLIAPTFKREGTVPGNDQFQKAKHAWF